MSVTLAALLGDTGLPPNEARILLGHVLGYTRTQLVTRSDESVDATLAARYRDAVARRLAGEPVAQIVGVREFYGLPLQVTPDVLIPRPETELLVELACAALATRPGPARVLDLGTGSGAVALAIAATLPDARVVATERSPAALAVAGNNAARLLDAARPGGPVRLLAGDWYEALPRDEAPFDIIVSNPPYIAAGDPHLEQGDLRFEPRAALTDEADGLDALRRIVAGAAAHLAPDGALWLEHGYDQAAAVRGLLAGHGFVAIRSGRDLSGIERTTGGHRPR
jgi:release factor glutamine methyltransferase